MFRNNLDRVANGMLKPINTTAILILGIFTIVWGFWLANPFWDVFTTAKLFSALHQFGGETTWGTIAVVTGTITSIGAIKGRPPALYWGACAASLHWLVISILYFIGDWHNTGGITALMLSIYSAYVYANIKVNYQFDDLPEDFDK